MVSDVLAAGSKETGESRKSARGRTTGLVADSIWRGKNIRINIRIAAQLQTSPRVETAARVRKSKLWESSRF